MNTNSLISSRCIILGFIIALSAIWSLFLQHLCGFGIGVFDDSGSYFLAGDNILKGNIDFLRTPLYPLLCHLFAWIDAPHALRSIATFQLVLFLTSAIALSDTLKRLAVSDKVNYAITTLYACCPILLNYTQAIITEPIAISFSTFFIWLLSCILSETSRTAPIIGAITLLFVMIMLRPFFLCFTPVLAIVILFALYRNRFNKKQLLSTGIATVAFVGLCFSYCHSYYNSYGKFSFSCVYELNRNMAMSKMKLAKPCEGIVHSDYNSRPDIHGRVLHIKDAWAWHPSSSYLHDCDQAYSKYKVRYIKNKVLEFHSTFYMGYSNFAKPNSILYYISSVIKLKIRNIYLFVLAFFFLECAVGLKRKTNIIMSLALIIIVAATIFTSIWGADEQYPRLMLPMFPSLFVMVGIFASRIKISLSSETE